MNKHQIAGLAAALAFVSMPTLADEPQTGAAPPRNGEDRADPGKAKGDKGRVEAVPTPKEKSKQRTIEMGGPLDPRAPGGESLGSRGPPKPDKNWDEMTLTEKDAARKAWLLNSGDFGLPGAAGNANPPPTSKDNRSTRGGTLRIAPKEKRPEK